MTLLHFFVGIAELLFLFILVDVLYATKGDWE
jgi:hypothetical protein